MGVKLFTTEITIEVVSVVIITMLAVAVVAVQVEVLLVVAPLAEVVEEAVFGSCRNTR